MASAPGDPLGLAPSRVSRGAASLAVGLLVLAVSLPVPPAGIGQTPVSEANNTTNTSPPARDVGEGVRGLSGGLLEAVILVAAAVGLAFYLRRDRGDR